MASDTAEFPRTPFLDTFRFADQPATEPTQRSGATPLASEFRLGPADLANSVYLNFSSSYERVRARSPSMKAAVSTAYTYPHGCEFFVLTVARQRMLEPLHQDCIFAITPSSAFNSRDGIKH